MPKFKTPEAKSYQDLSEIERSRFKSINDQGDYVAATAESDPEVAHRLALAENEAYGALDEKVKTMALTVPEIMAKMEEKQTSYDENRQLQEMLFQTADLARIKGESIDEDIKPLLEKKYMRLKYSSVQEKIISQNVAEGDIQVIGRLFLDEKFTNNYELFNKLKTDEERIQVFEICKTRISAACDVLKRMDNLDTALKMYEELLGLANEHDYSDKSELESTGKHLSANLFKAGRLSELVVLLDRGVFKLMYFKDFLHEVAGNQSLLIEMAGKSHTLEEVNYILKFIADPDSLEKIIASPSSAFAFLSEQDQAKAINNCKRIKESLNQPARVFGLSELKPNQFNPYSHEMEGRNKFVVGLNSENRYCIAYADMDRYEYHKDIFQALRQIGSGQQSEVTDVREFKSGGYLRLDEADGKMTVTMYKNSGDFGFYSREVMEHFRVDIETELRRQNPDWEIELKINLTTSY